LFFIRKLYIILKLGLFISKSGPSLSPDYQIARIGKRGGTNPIKELFTIVYSTIIFSIDLYLVRDIIVYKKGRFIKRRIVYKISSL
jgi:hypothetical protein